MKRREVDSQANQALLERIRQLKSDHPYWGYRRILAYLKYQEKMPVNRKQIHRLMKINHLLVPKNLKLKAPRKAATHNPRTVEPDRYWGIDMDKVMIATFGWIYLPVIIDWGTKKLLSTHVTLTPARVPPYCNPAFPPQSHILRVLSAHGVDRSCCGPVSAFVQLVQLVQFVQFVQLELSACGSTRARQRVSIPSARHSSPWAALGPPP